MTPRHEERGSALVEFLALALLFLIPVVYLILTLTQLHAGKFAALSAAQNAARAFVSAPDSKVGNERAANAVRVALDDQGFSSVPLAQALDISCRPDCAAQTHDVIATVTVPVHVPGIPFLGRGPALLTVEEFQIVSNERFRGEL